MSEHAPVQRLWAVTPVYNDVDAFLQLRERLLAVAAADARLAGAELRLVVIDDSAGLDDAERLHALPDVEVVTPPFNLGHQRALVYALRLLAPRLDDEDLVVTLDADGEDRPEDLPRLLEPLLERPAGRRDVSLALRSKRREGFFFRLFYVLFRIFFRALTGVVVRSGNYAAYRGWLARRMLVHPAFDLCYSSTLTSMDVAVHYVPCERGSRYAGRSRMSYSRLFIHGLSMLMPFTDRIAIRALLSFSVTMVLALVLALTVIGVRLFTERAIPGWATSTLLLLIILSFVALGNFVVLFTVFSQSRGLSLSNLEQTANGRAGGAPPPTDRALS